MTSSMLFWFWYFKEKTLFVITKYSLRFRCSFFFVRIFEFWNILFWYFHIKNIFLEIKKIISMIEYISMPCFIFIQIFNLRSAVKKRLFYRKMFITLECMPLAIWCSWQQQIFSIVTFFCRSFIKFLPALFCMSNRNHTDSLLLLLSYILSKMQRV